MRTFMAGLMAAIVIPSAMGVVPGNLNQDGIVDANDLIVLTARWLDPNEFLIENLDRQGRVDFGDFAILARYWLVRQEPDIGELTFLPGGTFQMGDSFSEGNSDELPLHIVTLNSFYMSRYEITNQQYCDFLNSAYGQGTITVISNVVYKAGSGTSYPYCDTNQSSTYSQINWDSSTFSVLTKSGRSMASDPMVMVSWYGAVAYCNWRSQQEGRQTCYNDFMNWTCDFSKNGYHLPTEAQWEYAARGGLAGRRFPWGDTITHSQANYYSSSSYSYDISVTRGYHPTWNDGVSPYTSPVGSFAPTGYGLYDIAGNVRDWCNDWYGSYSSSPQTNPTGPTTGSSRVLRGGNWYNTADYCHVDLRGSIHPLSRSHVIGFRISLE